MQSRRRPRPDRPDRHPFRFPFPRPCAALLLAALGGAQVPPGAGPPLDTSALAATPAPGSPAARRWQLGRDALAEGRADEAVTHLLAALEYHPAAPELLLDLALATGADDPEALWLERLVRAAADPKGRWRPDAAQKKRLGRRDLEPALALARLRAAAAAELAAAVERLPRKERLGDGVVARWLTGLWLELCADAPPLLAGHGPALRTALERYQPDCQSVCEALLRVAQGREPAATGAGPPDPAAARQRAARALAAARILAGLARQASFGDDLQGPAPPALEGMAAAAAEAVAAARAALGPPREYTIAELEAMDDAARDAFTLAHRSWADPAVTWSPTGRYRIETVCGHATLLGAATTIELHHERLAGHFGADPFADRPGTVRIVPEVAGLESEGAPFWWAGGFQSGDRTVIRFAWGSVPGMGRLLTHELTHRFDGVLHPFLKPWYVEGHAVWTAAHYDRMADRTCREDHLDVRICAAALGDGYGRRERLERLIRGELEDYRDNYVAGYALYAFLRGHPPGGPPRFRPALAGYERNARAGQRDPLGWFVQHFCDGEDGRPADFEAFAADWLAFLRGCSEWLDERTRGPDNAWVGRYAPRGQGDPAPLVLDEPTLTWSRDRAEPFFGQGHAAAAGDVLAAAGLVEAAAAAWLWSLSCEGWRRHPAGAALDVLQRLGATDAAAALRALLRARFPDAVPGPVEPVPMLERLPRTRDYLERLSAVAADHAAAARPVAAAALRGEHERLGAQLLLPPPAGPAALPPPPVRRALGGFGWAESSLTGYDDGRVPGLWFETGEGDLHVGRERPREGTGTFDRAAHRRCAFARSVEWLPPGHHVLRARIHFTTSFVRGAVIFGHWRRDRDLRLAFRAGDFDYATGRREENREFREVHLELHGLWERDHQELPQTRPALRCEFDRPSSWFDLELRIRGPSVLVLVNGEAMTRYTTHDGSPIEGYAGFATSQGAIRVQQPTVQRLDVAEPGQALAAVRAVGLDPQRQPPGGIDDLLHLPTHGLPRAPVGTLVLWLPRGGEDDLVDPVRRHAVLVPMLAKLLEDRVALPQEWVLAVPAGTPAASLAEMQYQLRAVRGSELPVLEHRIGAPFTGYPWLLFVDAHGLLRAAAEVGEAALHARVAKWARMFRAR